MSSLITYRLQKPNLGGSTGQPLIAGILSQADREEDTRAGKKSDVWITVLAFGALFPIIGNQSLFCYPSFMAALISTLSEN